LHPSENQKVLSALKKLPLLLLTTFVPKSRGKFHRKPNIMCQFLLDQASFFELYIKESLAAP